MTIIKLYDEVLRQKNKLDNAIELLSKRASEIYGKDLVADLCSGFEIEFRLSDYDNPHTTGENALCIEITIEELEKMEAEKNDRGRNHTRRNSSRTVSRRTRKRTSISRNDNAEL